MDERNEITTELKETVGVITGESSVSSEGEATGSVSSGGKTGRRRKKKKVPAWVIVLIIAAIIGGTVVLGFAIKNGMQKMQTAMEEAMDNMSGDDLYVVEKTDVEQEIATSGTTIGLEEDAYTSPVTAKVDDIRVEVGQTIHKGEVLLTYDTSDLGDNLAKVKIQAQSERAASNESLEAASKAAGKADTAETKAKKLKKQINSLKKEVEDLNDDVVSKQDELAEAQEKNAKAEAANEAAKAEAKEKAAAKALDAAEKGEAAENITTEAVKEEDLIDTKEIQNELRGLNKELTKKTEKLTEKQTELAEQNSIASANKEVTVSDSTKAQISAARELSDMNINDAQEAYDEGMAGITARTDGIISSVQIVKGSYASETQTLLTIIDADQIGVSFTISKDDLGSVKPNQKVRVVIGNNQYDGFVEYISRVASTDSAYQAAGTGSSGGNIQGKIVINNPDENLYIGISAKVYIFVGKSEGTLAVPYEALNTDIDGDYVYVVDKDNKIQRKDVKIGIFSDEYYEITEGIEEGDKVIREVTKDMKPGDEYVPKTAMPNMMGM
ncbi:MAG: efflux RND transporter periplasmic adaptor subunit [Lachnospiraceae bacterium]|nr:efflux RND transporter periplasmic adaptor subunit [Lachnospiraceae bacterium]